MLDRIVGVGLLVSAMSGVCPTTSGVALIVVFTGAGVEERGVQAAHQITTVDRDMITRLNIDHLQHDEPLTSHAALTAHYNASGLLATTIIGFVSGVDSI